MDGPTIIVTRRARAKGEDWRGARSYFGGMPMLGGAAWPVDGSGEAMHFLAQIDCAEIGHSAPGQLPSSGALCFFVAGEGGGGKVVYVPDPSAETIRPKGRAFSEVNGDLFPTDPGPDASALAPYWPIEFMAVPATGGTSSHELQRAVHAQLPKRQYFYNLALIDQTAPNDPAYYNAVTVRHLLALLRLSLKGGPARIATWQGFAATSRARMEELTRPGRSWLGWLMGGGATAEADKAILSAEKNYARQQDRVDTMQAQKRGFDFFVEEVADFAEGLSLGALTSEQFSRLNMLHRRACDDFGELTRYNLSTLDRLASTAHRIMMASPDPAVNAALPDAARSYINTHCRLTIDGWHQMFGRGVDIQSAASENEDKVLLLQLLYDDMVGWVFGDMGAYQFWISPEALRNKDFNAAFMTFECH